MKGSLVRRGKNRWAIVLDLPRVADPVTGLAPRRQKWVTFHGTRTNAEKRLTDLVSARNNDAFVEPSKRTLGDWLREWVELRQGPQRPWSDGTYARYKGIVDDYLVPSALGALPLQAVKAHHVEQYHADHRKSLAPGTLSLHQNILQRALRKAARDKLVARNEAKEVEGKPSARHTRDDAARDARVHCWTAAEAAQFLAHVKAHGTSQQAAFYAVLLDSGMRRGEVAGLQWPDVNLDTGTVTVARQLRKPDVEHPVFGPTKTGIVRTIPLAPETVALVKVHRAAQAAVKMRRRREYKPFDLVFAKDGLSPGAPLQVNNIAAIEFNKLIKTAKVKRIKLHGLRHTCATLLLGAREPIHNVAARLGHKNPTVTLQVYAHALPDQQEALARTIGSLIHAAKTDTTRAAGE
ncbi:MAG: site-specific integrase [Acidobacteria bacterium]|nr:site-specific integrase [Acidobacteriota bacterium]